MYKSSYSEYLASNYDKKDKTIIVELPDYIKPKFPKEWNKSGATTIYKNVWIQSYNSGYAENYLIKQLKPPYKHVQIYASLKAREEAILTVHKFIDEMNKTNLQIEERQKENNPIYIMYG